MLYTRDHAVKAYGHRFLVSEAFNQVASEHHQTSPNILSLDDWAARQTAGTILPNGFTITETLGYDNMMLEYYKAFDSHNDAVNSVQAFMQTAGINLAVTHEPLPEQIAVPSAPQIGDMAYFLQSNLNAGPLKIHPCRSQSIQLDTNIHGDYLLDVYAAHPKFGERYMTCGMDKKATRWLSNRQMGIKEAVETNYALDESVLNGFLREKDAQRAAETVAKRVFKQICAYLPA